MRLSNGDRIAAALFGVVALGSLGLKLANLRAEPRVDSERFGAAIVVRLHAAGFEAWPDGVGRHLRLMARRGACRLKAREFPPHGTLQDAYVELGHAVGPTRYAYRSAWLAAPPKMRPLLDYYVQRELARIGIDVPRRPIVAVAVGTACTAVRASWFDAPTRFVDPRAAQPSSP